MDKVLLNGMLWLLTRLKIAGIDEAKIEVICRTKLIMDRRRVRTNYRRSEPKEGQNQLVGTLVFYAVLGCLMAFVIFTTGNRVLSMILLHSFVIFLMSMTLITDFSSVLLDTTDSQIILPRPVNGKTLFLARFLHITVYLLQFTIALCSLPLIATFYALGVAGGFISIITILLSVALAVFFAYLIYMLILQLSNEQKVKDIISYFQIFLTILFTAGYQILPRVIDFDAMDKTFTLHYYSYFLPPVWMALMIEAITQLKFDVIHIALSLCAICIPIVTFWLMLKYLAPSFSRKLAALQQDTGTAQKSKTNKPIKTSSISSLFCGLTCSGLSEAAGFELTWKCITRERTFKMQFYPAIGYMAVFIFVTVFRAGTTFSQTWRDLPASTSYLWLIYIPMLMVGGSVRLINNSENFAASWIYFSTPIKYPGLVLSGALKALYLRLFLPVFALMLIIAFSVWGVTILDDFLLGFFTNLVLFISFELLSYHYMPFSRQHNINEQSGKLIQTFLQMLLISILVGLHYLALQVDYLAIILIMPAAMVSFFLLKKLQSLRWKNIKV